jgi:hypothetical protein
MTKLKMSAFGAMLFAAASANAGPLVSATYTQIIQGVTFQIDATTATGSLTGNTFTLNPGNAFASSFCLANPGATACTTGTGFPAPTNVMNIAAPFAPPVVGINVTFTANGPLTATLGDLQITQPSGIMGHVQVIAKIGKAPAFTLLPIAVNAGAGGNLTTPTTPSPTLQVFLAGDVWHLDAQTQTGLTSIFNALPDAMATGNVSVTSMAGMQFTHVNLVSLGRTKVRGLANTDTSTPTFLRLVYDSTPIPEPGTLMLLGAGVVGLVMIGRRKLN